jgi:hypothetical protein
VEAAQETIGGFVVSTNPFDMKGRVSPLLQVLDRPFSGEPTANSLCLSPLLQSFQFSIVVRADQQLSGWKGRILESGQLL